MGEDETDGGEGTKGALPLSADVDAVGVVDEEEDALADRFGRSGAGTLAELEPEPGPEPEPVADAVCVSQCAMAARTEPTFLGRDEVRTFINLNQNVGSWISFSTVGASPKEKDETTVVCMHFLRCLCDCILYEGV